MTMEELQQVCDFEAGLQEDRFGDPGGERRFPQQISLLNWLSLGWQRPGPEKGLATYWGGKLPSCFTVQFIEKMHNNRLAMIAFVLGERVGESLLETPADATRHISEWEKMRQSLTDEDCRLIVKGWNNALYDLLTQEFGEDQMQWPAELQGKPKSKPKPKRIVEACNDVVVPA